MRVDKNQIRFIWWEDKDGNKYYPPPHDISRPSDKYIYYHTMMPDIHHEVHWVPTADDIRNCDHDLISTNDEWIAPIVGRRCKKCGAYQTKEEGQPWPDKWEWGTVHICTNRSSFEDNIALAMANSGNYTLKESIIILARCCERCTNAFAFTYNVPGGYPEYSLEWCECNTECDYCKPMEPGKYARIGSSPLAVWP